jgi:methylmalonyl-CoA mutase N-terminal domain/subunit
MVGVNAFQSGSDDSVEMLHISDDLANEQIDRLNRVKANRDRGEVANTLEALKASADGDENTMPRILACVKAYCSVGEISDALRDVFGSYEEPAVF